MKAYIFVCLFALVAHQVASQSCHLRELDLCAATLLLFNQGNGVPSTNDDVNRQCEAIQEARDCLTNFTNKCMTPLQREILDFVTEGSLKLYSEFCTEGKELRASFLKHAPCLNDVANNDDTKACISDMQVAIETIGESDFDKRISLACCGYQRLMECVHDNMEKTCGEEAVQMGTTMMKMAVSNLPDVVCQGYKPGSDKCNDLPPAGTQPKGSNSNSALSRLFAAYLGN